MGKQGSEARRRLRRRILEGAGLAALGGSGLAMPWQSAVAAPARIATPSQSLGPFYPVDWDGDADADLVVVRGEAASALGTVAHVRGRVVDIDGQPLAGAFVEIWQCDANGIYRHPRDQGQARRDPGFQGRGQARAGDDGGWAFRTIRPVPYPGRTPHIHFQVRTLDGRQLITQLYVAGEPGNERDFLLNAVRDPRARERLIARFDPADRIEAGALLAEFEIVIA
ncbi:MAG TPA: protocatechuate 3,4-dioxygenase [Burkholderiaceae bacterium]|nr:protocatechuate 3,4-dioxygenase [Burkholderiaceae bacterium]